MRRGFMLQAYHNWWFLVVDFTPCLLLYLHCKCCPLVEPFLVQALPSPFHHRLRIVSLNTSSNVSSRVRSARERGPRRAPAAWIASISRVESEASFASGRLCVGGCIGSARASPVSRAALRAVNSSQVVLGCTAIEFKPPLVIYQGC